MVAELLTQSQSHRAVGILVTYECLHGRYYPPFADIMFNPVIVTSLENTSPEYKQKLESLLTDKIRLFDNAA